MSRYDPGRHQILTPALEGSKVIHPVNTWFPVSSEERPFTDRRVPLNMLGPYNHGLYPGAVLPPIGSPVIMPAERINVPTLMPRRRVPYAGPPGLMPYWGGYSVGGQYYPEEKREDDETERQVIPVPIRMPKAIGPPPAPQPPIITHQPPAPPKKTVRRKVKRTFPGPAALRRFRHVALVAAFIAMLNTNRKKNLSNRPSSMFLFGIILKEIVAALHRIYLNPNGNIYPVLNDIIGPNCYDLASLVHGGRLETREESVLIQELQYVIENLVYHITEIMPSTGVLGTHRKSAVFELIRSGKRFPDGYFWQVEMDRLQFGENGRTVNVGDSEGFMLLLGIFISRSFVTTLLMKPVDYGLSSSPLSEVAESNLRIVASTLLYLVRRISIQRGRGIMEMPSEIAKYLYSDEEMQHVYSRLSRTFNYSEGLLREWGTEYIRRLRASSMQT